MNVFVVAALAFSALTGVAAEVLTLAALPPTRLRFGSVTFYSENDKYFAGTDHNYTNGFKCAEECRKMAKK